MDKLTGNGKTEQEPQADDGTDAPLRKDDAMESH